MYIASLLGGGRVPCNRNEEVHIHVVYVCTHIHVYMYIMCTIRSFLGKQIHMYVKPLHILMLEYMYNFAINLVSVELMKYAGGQNASCTVGDNLIHHIGLK